MKNSSHNPEATVASGEQHTRKTTNWKHLQRACGGANCDPKDLVPTDAETSVSDKKGRQSSKAKLTEDGPACIENKVRESTGFAADSCSVSEELTSMLNQ